MYIHELDQLIHLCAAVVAGLQDWFTGLKMRKRMQKRLGRRVSDRELVSLQAWMVAGATAKEFVPRSGVEYTFTDAVQIAPAKFTLGTKIGLLTGGVLVALTLVLRMILRK
jgi:hypothetical protein